MLPTEPTVNLADTENEQAVLGQALVRDDARDALLSRSIPEDFGIPEHRKLTWSLQRCAQKNLAPTNDTLVMVSRSCKMEGDLTVGYLRSLRREFGKPNPNYAEHLRKLKADAAKRYLYNDGAARLRAVALDPDAGIDALQNAIRELGESVERGRTSTELEMVDGRGITDAHDEVDRQRLGGGGFWTTGFDYIDAHLTEGLAPGKVSIWGGRTGMCKSSLVINVMWQLARRKIPVAQFALEMNTTSVVDRLLSLISRIPTDKIVKYRLKMSRKEQTALKNAKTKIARNKFLYIDDRPRVSLAYIRQQIRLLKQLRGHDYLCVFVDLFGKVEDLDDLSAQKYERALGEIQIMARELGVHIGLVAQIRRIEQGKDYWKFRPRFDQIKNSGAWEEVADLIILLFRAKYYDNQLGDDVLEVNIAKQRMGGKDIIVNFLYDGEVALVRPTDCVPYDARPEFVRGNR